MSLILIPTRQINALSQNHYKYGLIATCISTAATSAWGYYEHYKKNKIKFELDNLKNDESKLQSSQAVLETIEVFNAKIRHDYQELGGSIGIYSVDIEQIINFVKNHISIDKKDIFHNLNSLQDQIKEDLNKSIKFKNELELRIIEWNNDLRAQHIAMAKVSISTLNGQIYWLQSIYDAFCQEKEYIKLELIIRKNYDQKYDKELKIMEFVSSKDTFQKKLDQHIKAIYSESEHQFPYLSYGEKLKRDLSIIQNSLNNIPDVKLLPFQQETIEKAKQLYYVLSNILEYLVITNKYMEEKDKKPEYDRQQANFKQQLKEKQERLEAELREKQAKIDRENMTVQAKLLDEQNRAHHLANQEAEINRQRKQLEVREREISLELSRIQSGQIINDAIKNNDKDWQKRMDREQLEYTKTLNKLENDLSILKKLIKDLTSEKDKLNKKNNDLIKDLGNAETEKSNLYNQITDFRHQINDLRDRMIRIKNQLEELQGSARNFPYNPESVDGLPEYINKLQYLISQIQSI